MSHISMILRHHGASQYDASKFQSIRNHEWRNKPTGGLWTSPINSEFGWKEWCEMEEYHNGPLDEFFDLDFAGRVYVINSLNDLLNIPLRKDITSGFRGEKQFVDYERLVDLGYDAIHLTVRGQQETRWSEPIDLYGWDCETVFVMNPKSIKSLALSCPKFHSIHD